MKKTKKNKEIRLKKTKERRTQNAGGELLAIVGDVGQPIVGVEDGAVRGAQRRH